MKKTLTTISIALLAAFTLAMTPFSFTFKNPDGTASTNTWQMTLYPPSTGIVVFGTNFITGNYTNTLVPDATGNGTNQCLPATFRVFCPASGIGFIVNVPDTNISAPLTTYATAPVVYPNASPYGFLTNLLGFIPMPSNSASVIGALTYTPAKTNGPLLYANLPFTPPSNNYVGISNAVGFLLPTNTPAGIEYGLGFTPLTNNPATNYYISDLTWSTNASTFNLTNMVKTTNTIIYQHP